MKSTYEIATEKLAQINEWLCERVVTYHMFLTEESSFSSLRTNPAIPSSDASFNREQATKWVESHRDPTLRRFAQGIIDNLRHISFGAFYQSLIQCMQDLNRLYQEESIENDEILIVVPALETDKSNPWVTSLALAQLRVTPKYILSTAPQEMLGHYLKCTPGIKRILTFDDASYSAIDLSFILETVVINARAVCPDICLDIVVPYTTSHAKTRLSKLGNVISAQIMPTLADVLTCTPKEASMLEEHLAPRSRRRLHELTLCYFDHKLADQYSVPEKCLRDGMQIDSNNLKSAIPFIPRIIPCYKHETTYLYSHEPSRLLHSVSHVLTESQCQERIADTFQLK